MTLEKISTLLPDDPLLAEVLGELFSLKARSFAKLGGLNSLTTDTASTVKVHPELEAYLKVTREITSTLNEAGLTPKARGKSGKSEDAQALDDVRKFLGNRGPSNREPKAD